MTIFFAFLIFIAVVAGVSLAGMRLYVKPKEAMERVAGTSNDNDAPPVHPSLVFHDIVKRLGTFVPVSPKDVTVMQRRLIRAGIRNPNALKILYGAKALFGVLLPALVTLSIFNASLGLDQAILQVAKELEHAHPEITEELAIVNLELKAGKRRAEALRNLADRTAVDDLKKLVAVLIQADRFGTGVAQSLRAHSDYMRVQARQIAEEKAAKLGVKLVFPIFFCILPSLFVVTVGPVVMKIMRELLPMMNNM